MKLTASRPPIQQSAISPTLTTIAPGEIIIGEVVGINAQGQALVDYADTPLDQPLPAISTLGITQHHIGRQVALLFANGNPKAPVIMGIIHSPLQDVIAAYEELPVAPTPDPELTVNGERLVIEGKEEIVLKCGEASITLTRAGKILIRGKYVLSRSDGVNRMMGGSVQVN